MHPKLKIMINNLLEIETLNDYSDYGDTSSCPICQESVNHITHNMDDIEHDENCSYVIAKDIERTIKLDII